MKNIGQAERKQSTKNSKANRIDLEMVEKIEQLSAIARTLVKESASNAVRFSL